MNKQRVTQRASKEGYETAIWKLVGRSDTRARVLADRHYSRQTQGSAQFCPPGNSIVLLGIDDNALWVTQRPDPSVSYLQVRRDGFEYWSNTYFRNESPHRASEMILEAVAITLYLWGKNDIPNDGLHTFVDPRKVKPTRRRGQDIWGYCFLKAGFTRHPDATKSRDLLRFSMSREQLLLIAPVEPVVEQLVLL